MATWEWEVAESTLPKRLEGECSHWTLRDVFAYVYRHSQEIKYERAVDCLSVAGQ